jgi:IPT/TIG domain/Bacterial Ig-like domain (group 2)
MNGKAVLMRVLVILGIASLVFLGGCGGGTSQSFNQPPPASGSNPTPMISTISPTSAVAGAPFTLTINGTNFVAASMVNFGETAPTTTFVSATQLTVAIPAAAIPSAGTATVTVTDPAPGGGTSNAVNFTITKIPPLPVAVAVSPTSATVQAGGEQQFTATVSPIGTNQAVTWNVSGSSCTGTSCGMIDTTGKYTAPATVPNPPTVLVTATPVADSTKADTATVTITSAAANPNNAKLSGQYAFLFSGFNSAGLMSIVGSFTADGSGNLIVGNTDVTVFGGTKTNQGLTNSTYSVAPNNSGTMSLNTAVNFPTDSFSFTFSFALGAFASSGVADEGRLIESDGTRQTGTGFFVKQDAAAFSTAAISGGFAFGLAGPSGIDENVGLGRFTASDGSLSAGHIDLIGFGSGGLQPDQPFIGTYSVDASGRGIAALDIFGQPNSLSLILYVVSSGESLWMDASGSGATGMALQQSIGPFNASSLKGTSVFGAAGFAVAGNDVAVGEVQFDGTGNVSGTNDENYFGLSFSDEPITGTYTVDSNGLGRGAISEASGPGLSTFYLVSPGRGFIISGNDSLEFGTFEHQTGEPFSNASFSGNYTLGAVPLLSTVGTSFASGALTADGVGNLSGTLTTKGGTQTIAGTYAVSTNGRTTLSITPISGSPSNLVFYFVSPAKAVGVQMTDFGPANVAVNVIEK